MWMTKRFYIICCCQFSATCKTFSFPFFFPQTGCLFRNDKTSGWRACILYQSVIMTLLNINFSYLTLININSTQKFFICAHKPAQIFTVFSITLFYKKYKLISNNDWYIADSRSCLSVFELSSINSNHFCPLTIGKKTSCHSKSISKMHLISWHVFHFCTYWLSLGVQVWQTIFPLCH